MSKVHLTQPNLAAQNSLDPIPPPGYCHVMSTTDQDLAGVALKALSHAVITTNLQGQIQHCNASAQALISKAQHRWPSSDIMGMPLHDILPLFHGETRQPLDSLVQQLQNAQPAVALTHQAILVTADGQERVIDLTVIPVYDAATILMGAVCMLWDVTDAHQAIHTLAWQASHDALTGLVNRSEFELQLTQAIHAAQTAKQRHTLCYIDIDQFKIVNDTYGHNAGDKLLQRLSQIFQHEIRSIDALSRLGSDEFGILFYDCNLKQACHVVERIHQQVSQFRFLWQEQSFSVSASFGLVQIDATSESLTSVLSAADAACYAAKEAGRNRIHLYYNDDDQLLRQRSERLWISQIYQAIEEQRLLLYSQDIVPIGPDRAFVEPTGVGQLQFERHVEILLRMADRDGTIIPPSQFIPAAERYGLMTAIDRVVIETFFRAYAQACLSHSGRPLDSCLYAINLSARSLNDDQFIDFVKAQFVKYRLPPHVICFEITETAAIDNVEQASQLIEELKQMGCHFALDDFGSGMNCFAYLKQLKIDYLKIDGSFIKDITTDKIDQELVACMNRIAHVLGIKTVAEWVENDAILQTLQKLNIDYAQGYGIHKPEPLEFLLVG
jgi:diguanylate cyclase (GGDEF)-like protein